MMLEQERDDDDADEHEEGDEEKIKKRPAANPIATKNTPVGNRNR
jgi:hypothetical protein